MKFLRDTTLLASEPPRALTYRPHYILSTTIRINSFNNDILAPALPSQEQD